MSIASYRTRRIETASSVQIVVMLFQETLRRIELAATSLEKIEIWIKPELYYTTSYAMELYEGEGTSGALLGTSATTVSRCSASSSGCSSDPPRPARPA